MVFGSTLQQRSEAKGVTQPKADLQTTIKLASHQFTKRNADTSWHNYSEVYLLKLSNWTYYALEVDKILTSYFLANIF